MLTAYPIRRRPPRDRYARQAESYARSQYDMFNLPSLPTMPNDNMNLSDLDRQFMERMNEIVNLFPDHMRNDSWRGIAARSPRTPSSMGSSPRSRSPVRNQPPRRPPARVRSPPSLASSATYTRPSPPSFSGCGSGSPGSGKFLKLSMD